MNSSSGNRVSTTGDNRQGIPPASAVNNRCPSCGSNDTYIFYHIANVPVHSVVLIETRKAAMDYPTGDIELTFCRCCTFIFNSAFNPSLVEYSSDYEATQGFSPTFNAFAQTLAGQLIQRYDLHNKTILEIGCGNGEFLTLLCRLGGNRGIGFDPAFLDSRAAGGSEVHTTFIKDLYSEKYREHKADFICCKMTLEHISETGSFIAMVRQAIGDNPDTVVFFQVPSVNRILKDCAFEDIYYEHCSYFSPGSLSKLFEKNGFSVLKVGIEYDSQYITIEAKPTRMPQPEKEICSDDIGDIAALVANFDKRCGEKIHRWRERLTDLKGADKRAVIWGSGSKGVAFLTALDIGIGIEYVVDINPHKQGCHMPGTGQEIITPDRLVDYRPDTVIVMNAIYVDEIRKELSGLGLTPEISAI